MKRHKLLVAMAVLPTVGAIRPTMAAGVIAAPAPLATPVKLKVGAAKVAHLAPFADVPAMLRLDAARYPAAAVGGRQRMVGLGIRPERVWAEQL